jgi:hypothetical protein
LPFPFPPARLTRSATSSPRSSARKCDYVDLARRSEVTEEDYWLQADPAGDLLVVASDSDQQKFLAIMANPETEFDRWLAEQLPTIFGFDPAAPGRAVNESLGRLVVD